MDDRKPTPMAAGKEARTKLAIRKVPDGRTWADVAGFLGVHPVTVAEWMRAYRAGGDDALTASRHPAGPASRPTGEKPTPGPARNTRRPKNVAARESAPRAVALRCGAR